MFFTRLKPVWKIEEIILKASSSHERSGSDLYPRLGFGAQGQRIDHHHLVVALDERGIEMSSPQLANWIQDKFDKNSVKQLSFVIGGPYGLHEDITKRADLVWSLARGVYPSDMAWIMVWEQLYRASNIIRKTGYHHE